MSPHLIYIGIIMILLIISYIVISYIGGKGLEYEKKFLTLNLAYATLLNQKKSSEVKLGLMTEQFAPFLKDWPCGDVANFRFIGSPIDGISFNSDEITFVEIKTGNAKRTKKQNEIKKLIEDKKISFITVRFDENGTVVK